LSICLQISLVFQEVIRSTLHTETALDHHVYAVESGDPSDIRVFFEAAQPMHLRDSWMTLKWSANSGKTVWQSGASAPLGTETCFFKDNKIAVQTYAVHFD